MSFLRVDYNKAIAQAKQLERAAAECDQAISDLRKEKERSDVFWVGDSGNAMRMQFMSAEKELINTKRRLTEIAGNIRRVAGELKRKDEELKRKIESVFH